MVRNLLCAVIVVALAGWTASYGADKDAKDTKETKAAAEAVDVEAAVQKGLKLYKEGKIGEAVTSLQEAINAMQQAQQKGLIQFFPKAPDGWEAGKADAQSASYSDGTGKAAGVFTTTTQTFTRKSDGRSVSITMTTSPQLIEGYKAVSEMYRNADFLKAMNAEGKQKVEMINKDGWTGWSIVSKDSEAEAMLVNGSTLLTIHVNKDDAATLNQFLKLMDLKGLAGAQTKTPEKPAK